jgi:hypothetical protein
MVVPVLLGAKSVFCGTAPFSVNLALSSQPLVATAAVGVHTISHLVISGLIAWVVYDFVGLAVLRRSWINLDLIWCFSLLEQPWYYSWHHLLARGRRSVTCRMGQTGTVRLH